jgi:hypothetical protein
MSAKSRAVKYITQVTNKYTEKQWAHKKIPEGHSKVEAPNGSLRDTEEYIRR